VHKASLDFASAGVYSSEQIAGVNPDRLRRFFTCKGDNYHVSQSLRESIIFAPHNVIRDAPFTKLDLVACRNLLIYFQPHAQSTVLTLFHFALKPGGYLFLGSSESPGGLVEEFDVIDDHAKVYRKRRDVGLPRDLKLPIPRGSTIARVPPAAAPRRTTGVDSVVLGTYDRLLDRFMPPSFLLDAEGQLVDTFGGVESLLRIRPRRPTQNLVDLLPDDLRGPVSGILHRVRRETESVRHPNVTVPGSAGRFALIAEAIRDGRGELNHILLSVADADAGTMSALVPPFVDVPGPGAVIDAPHQAMVRAGCRRSRCARSRTSWPTPRNTCSPPFTSTRPRTRNCRPPTRN
jgi:two-component system CheB/CheR fusion protein